jgi:hypothetical protein
VLRQADLISIASATDIHNTEFDDPAFPVSPKGDLNSTITPAKYVSFVNYLDDTQLARFGLHNGTFLLLIPNNRITTFCWSSRDAKWLSDLMFQLLLFSGDPDDETDLNAKWESLALASCQDEANPDDFFLFTAVCHTFKPALFLTNDGFLVR